MKLKTKKRTVLCIMTLIIALACQNEILAFSSDVWAPAQGFLQTIGNMIFVGATTVLGVKYIWGGAEGEASVKESLLTLIVAAIFFYSWSTIRAILITPTNNLVFMGATAEATALNIYSTLLYFLNFMAVGGIVYVGVKYMMAGAEARASLKTKSVPIVLGIILTYSAVTFLNLVLKLV